MRLARLNQPIGSWLLVIPCWWSILFATEATLNNSTMSLFIQFTLGAIVMRGAGCTLNDIIDSDFDQKVKRTATRPIPQGDVSLSQAVVFLIFQLLIGFIILIQFNTTTIYLGIGSLVLIFAYPFAKRYTHWPQLLLGLTFNWGALMGWASIKDALDWPAVMLYIAGIFWTLGYDTIYAHQDKEDDILIGVKSTAIIFGVKTRTWLGAFYAAVLLIIICLGNILELNVLYFIGASFCGLHLAWQVYRLNTNDSQDCFKKFKSNRDFGLMFLFSILLGYT